MRSSWYEIQVCNQTLPSQTLRMLVSQKDLKLRQQSLTALGKHHSVRQLKLLHR